jgi:hypothetical protein
VTDATEHRAATWIRGPHGEHIKINDPIGLIPSCPKCGDVAPHVHLEEVEADE